MSAPIRRAFAVIAVIAAALAGCRGHDDAAQSELLVGAAVSLGEMLQEASRQYEAAHHTAIHLNLAASNVLARQIQEGAPMDVFISADDAQMDAVTQQIAPGTRVPLYGNALVVMVRDGWSEPMRTLADLEAPAVTRIAIGDPAAVPAGVYAKQLLVRTGRWNGVEDRLVDSGHADAAIVYRTDARAARHARLAFEITGPDAPRIVYPAAALADSAHLEQARAWLAWLEGPQGRAVAARYGFMPAPAP